MKIVEMKEMVIGFWAKNSKGSRSWERDLTVDGDEDNAERRAVNLSVVATRGWIQKADMVTK